MALTTRNARVLTGLLLFASALLVAGLVIPMMTITKLVFFSDSFSVLLGVYELFQNGNYILFILVAGFSIVLSILKIGVLFRVLTFRKPDSTKT